MTERRQFELSLLRFLPFTGRDDFITIGFTLLEDNGWFKDMRFTRDWHLLRCIAPEMELEWLEAAEREIRDQLQFVQNHEDVRRLIEVTFGSTFDVAPVKGILADNPAKEMETLTAIHLAASSRGDEPHRAGRKAIVYQMSEAFSKAGVLKLMQTDLDMGRYMGVGDPFRIDFGYRTGATLKMFHGVSVAVNVDQALALAYRYSRIEQMMRQEQLQPSFTAILEHRPAVKEERNQFAIDTMGTKRSDCENSGGYRRDCVGNTDGDATLARSSWQLP